MHANGFLEKKTKNTFLLYISRSSICLAFYRWLSPGSNIIPDVPHHNTNLWIIHSSHYDYHHTFKDNLSYLYLSSYMAVQQLLVSFKDLCVFSL